LAPKHPVLLVTGDGRQLAAEIERFLDFGVEHDVAAIGRSMSIYPGKVRHWVNVDGTDSKWWAEHVPGKPIRHSMGDFPWFDVDWDVEGDDPERWHGSTALFAAYIGLAMGYEKIVLAGCPMDKLGHWYWGDHPDNTGPNWQERDYQAWRDFAATPGASRVRSFGGFTAEILGTPTIDWLKNSSMGAENE